MKETIVNFTELELLIDLFSNGGPGTKDFLRIEQLLQRLYQKTSLRKIPMLTQNLHKALGKENLQHTLHGFAFRKPHGYAGDFEIIDKTYRKEVHPDRPYAIWDELFHATTAAQAVRNRKGYFKELMNIKKQAGKSLHVLNLASGPCRDVFEWFEESGDRETFFDCIEMDANAIAFAETLNHSYLYNLHFTNKNIFRFQPKRQYDLVWSAGLFDYFTDEVFVKLLRRMKSWVLSGGNIVIGNFSTFNPSQGYMMIMTDWPLQLRGAENLKYLAKQAGFEDRQIFVGSEEAKVNLFLHLQL